MPQTLTPERLTREHLLLQEKIRLNVTASVWELWELLDLADLDGTTPRWLRATVPVVKQGYERSGQVAAEYLTDHRIASIGVPLADPIEVPPLKPQQTVSSLTTTGPIALKKRIAKEMVLAKAISLTRAGSSDAGARLSMLGARRTILDVTRRDPASVGWRRITDGNACDFCLMLAGRGYVYGADSVEFSAHDRCGCMAEPGYKSAYEPTAEEREAYERIKRRNDGQGPQRKTPRRSRGSGGGKKPPSGRTASAADSPDDESVMFGTRVSQSDLGKNVAGRPKAMHDVEPADLEILDDDKHFASDHEREMAAWMRTSGARIEPVARSSVDGIRTPDALVNGRFALDFARSSSPSSIVRHLRGKRRQARRLAIDVRQSALPESEVVAALNEGLRRYGPGWDEVAVRLTDEKVIFWSRQ